MKSGVGRDSFHSFQTIQQLIVIACSTHTNDVQRNSLRVGVGQKESILVTDPKFGGSLNTFQHPHAGSDRAYVLASCSRIHESKTAKK
jgi:hypothetical protein